MSGTQKVCPVVLREISGRIDVLAFRHPLAGSQFVKGTIEAAETIQDAAERELLEESGIAGAAIDYLGIVQMIEPPQEWHFVVCRVGHLAEKWTHRTSDDGGLDFEFFWHPINQEPNETWHPIFKQALAFLRQSIKPRSNFRSRPTRK